jgi:hypothetical protein
VLVIQGDETRSMDSDGAAIEDWMAVLIECIDKPNNIKDRKIKRRALRHTVIDGSLYR